MYCIHCGTTLPDYAKFCRQCGKPVETEDTSHLESAELHHSVTLEKVMQKAVLVDYSKEKDNELEKKSTQSDITPQNIDARTNEEDINKDVDTIVIIFRIFFVIVFVGIVLALWEG